MMVYVKRRLLAIVVGVIAILLLLTESKQVTTEIKPAFLKES